jgi:hypothetical protein
MSSVTITKANVKQYKSCPLPLTPTCVDVMSNETRDICGCYPQLQMKVYDYKQG